MGFWNSSKEETEKETPESKKSAAKEKRLDIAVRAIADNITFSKSEQYAYYRLAGTPYDFLSDSAKVSVAAQLVNAFTNLMNDRQTPLECQIIMTSTPIDIEMWEEQVREVTTDWNKAPGFEKFMRDQIRLLQTEQYQKKVTYLAVKLGKRGALNVDAASFIESGVKGAKESFGTWASMVFKTPGEEISASEERDARRREEEFFRILSTGNLRATRCTAEELLLLIKRQFYPSMPSPYLDVDHEKRVGPGDLELELTSGIHNRLRWLEINQMVHGHEYVGYRAALSIAKLPKEVHYPYTIPFLYFLNYLGLPFNSYSRFTLHPTSKMRKNLEKKKKEQKDELDNLAEGGNTVDGQLGIMPSDMTEAIQDMKLLNDMLAGGKTPWVEGSYRLIVETPTEELLKKYCSEVIQRFADIDVTVKWTVGDQKELFCEQMPGDKLRVDYHQQITDLSYLGTSGFMNSSEAGDLIFDSDAGDQIT